MRCVDVEVEVCVSYFGYASGFQAITGEFRGLHQQKNDSIFGDS